MDGACSRRDGRSLGCHAMTWHVAGEDLRHAAPGARNHAGRCTALATGLLTAVVLSGCGAVGSGAATADRPSADRPGTASAAATAPASPKSPVSQTAAPMPAVTRPSADLAAPAAAPSTPAPPPPPPPPALDGLKPGDTGPAVVAAQQQLIQLGFWVQAADGTYGDSTAQAVLALQKATGLERDGVLGPRSRLALTSAPLMHPRSTSGHWVEIDRSRQLLMIVDNGRVRTIFNTSTGSGEAYFSGGSISIAATPAGQYGVFRQVDHLDPGPLGDLWRPKYFNRGIAVHGATSVPAYAASHGCARVSNEAMDWIWSTDAAPVGTSVWVY